MTVNQSKVEGPAAKQPTASALLKTAERAFEASNFKRELQLAEQAVSQLQNATTLQRYISALYRNGEYRAIQVLFSDVGNSDLLKPDFLTNMNTLLSTRNCDAFPDILTKLRQSAHSVT
jgi:F0F1-type ATP synthase delta subunit